MRARFFMIFVGLLIIACDNNPQKNVLQIHPDNPHYFSFKGKPTILFGSTEHYGAVLNSEFDCIKYLDEVQRSGQNLTRTFSGVYCEDPTAFNITRNALAPAPGMLLSPWARSEQSGYFNGGNQFDLNRWDDAYFERLTTFVAEACKRDIVVEFVLFCTYYEDSMWNLSPMNAINNINSIGAIANDQVLTLRHADLTRVQEAFVRKAMQELNRFDNVYYEICNEPYFVSVTPEFQRFVSQTIRETEATLPKKHLIAQNIANTSAKIENPDPNVDFFNFHYASSAAVDLNYHLNKPIGDDETGFVGTDDAPYRKEGWNFIVSGGALYDHLDYSYAVGYEDGTFVFPPTQPGGGGRPLRAQFHIMRQFIEGFDFIRMRPLQEKLVGGVPDHLAGRLLGQEGEAYIGYFYQKGEQAQNISLRWRGKVIPERSGEVTFFTTTDDGVRLWVDGKLLINDWTNHAPTENSGALFLTVNKAVDFLMEFYQGAGGAEASIKWMLPGQAKSDIPDERFRLGDGAPGLTLEYFNDVELKTMRGTTTVKNVRFSGDLGALFPETPTDQPLAPVIQLPQGQYHVQWLNTMTGAVAAEEMISSEGGEVRLSPPAIDQDIALGIHRVGR